MSCKLMKFQSVVYSSLLLIGQSKKQAYKTRVSGTGTKGWRTHFVATTVGAREAGEWRGDRRLGDWADRLRVTGRRVAAAGGHSVGAGSDAHTAWQASFV